MIWALFAVSCLLAFVLGCVFGAIGYSAWLQAQTKALMGPFKGQAPPKPIAFPRKAETPDETVH